MSSSPKMSKSLTQRHTRSLGQNREKKSASSRPRISALIHKLVFYREKIFTISQPWHSLLPEAIAKVMWEGKTLDWGRSIIFTIQSLYMTALDFFFFFLLFNFVQCGLWLLLHNHTKKTQNMFPSYLYAVLSWCKNCISFTSTGVSTSFPSKLLQIVFNCPLHCEGAGKTRSWCYLRVV